MVIAGVMSPVQKNKIEELAHNLEVKLPGDTRVAAKKWKMCFFQCLNKSVMVWFL